MPKNKPQSSAKAGTLRKSVAPQATRPKPAAPAARKSVAPIARRSATPPARKSVAPPAHKSIIPPPPPVPRKLGLRGAAPWALRHAERQAEEAARRNREPPKPGSARATLRTPQGADRIKASIGELHGLLQRLRALHRNLEDGFFELGEILTAIEVRKLHEAKGYSNIETFAERELGLGKGMAHKLVRIPAIFQPAAAKTLRLEALVRALDAIDQTPKASVASRVAKLPLKPPR